MTVARHIIVLVLGLGLSGAAQAESGLSSFSSNSNQPVEIFADNGVEWQQDGQIFIARGNARAVRGDTVVYGEILKAYYRKKPAGGSDLYRVDAEINVKITSPTETVFGDKAIYDMENAVLVVTGHNLKLVTENEELTARQSLEYWTEKELAVARGNAVAVQVREGKRLRGDVLTGQLTKNKDGKSEMKKVNAFGNVTVVTPQETVTGEKGVYTVATGIAVLSGSVKITRGDNQLNGCDAEVNMNTGISKLFACTKGGGERVRGLLVPPSKGGDGAGGAAKGAPKR